MSPTVGRPAKSPRNTSIIERSCPRCWKIAPLVRLMIEGLDLILEGTGQPGVVELRGLLEELLGGRGATGRFLEQHIPKTRDTRVFHLHFAINNKPRSVFVKRLKPEIARRNELV